MTAGTNLPQWTPDTAMFNKSTGPVEPHWQIQLNFYTLAMAGFLNKQKFAFVYFAYTGLKGQNWKDD